METSCGLNITPMHVSKTGKMSLTAQYGHSACEPFKIDIFNAQASDKFTAWLQSKFPALKGVTFDEQLNKSFRELATWATKQMAGKPDQPPQESAPTADELLAKMSEQARADAEALLSATNLIDQIASDIEVVGVAGERLLALTVYLVGTSRLLAEPLAAILQGPSSGGKSYLLSKVADLMPPESVIRATQMTPQCLYTMPAGSLVHRFIVAGERSRKQDDDTADATKALREMISGRRLDKLMPAKEHGQIVTKRISQEGPIAYAESTTLTEIFDEDANRSIRLQVDETPEQTQRVLKAISTAARNGRQAANVETIVNKHHAAQRMLKSLPVCISFAERLGLLFPKDRVEARRALPQVLNMIRVSALLHQFQREHSPGGELIATIADYKLTRELLEKPMSQLLGGAISEAENRLLIRLREWFAACRFTIHDIMQKEHLHERTVRGWLHGLYGAGFLELFEVSRGHSPNVWVLVPEKDANEATGVLPTVEKVFPPPPPIQPSDRL
jgi:hypothetical protein